MNRRSLLIGASGSLLTAMATRAWPQEVTDVEIDGDLPPLPDDLAQFAGEPPAPYTELAGVGTGKPKSEEIEAAYKILLESPYNTSHLEVVKYFVGLSSGQAM